MLVPMAGPLERDEREIQRERRFMDSFAHHEDDLLAIEEPGVEPAGFDAAARAELREYYGDGPEGAVLPVLAARHVERLVERLPRITHYARNATHPEFPLALLAWGTRLAEGIRVRHRDSVIFDDGYEVWAMTSSSWSSPHRSVTFRSMSSAGGPRAAHRTKPTSTLAEAAARSPVHLPSSPAPRRSPTSDARR